MTSSEEEYCHQKDLSLDTSLYLVTACLLVSLDLLLRNQCDPGQGHSKTGHPGAASLHLGTGVGPHLTLLNVGLNSAVATLQAMLLATHLGSLPPFSLVFVFSHVYNTHSLW